MSVLLETRNAGRTFGQGESAVTALRDFSFLIDDAAPSITAIAGESGSGKSTLANMLLGFVKPSQGEVLYRGKDLSKLSREEQRAYRLEVQAIFQDPFGVYNPFYKVDHLLKVPLKTFNIAKGRAARERIENALLTVGLNPSEVLGRYPHQLSGGQRQRITIARALLLQPKLIIADEPVSMVDASLRASILESLMTLYRDFGISFVYITHDLATAYQISQNIVILYQGTVAEAGPVKQVIENPQHPYTQLLVQSIPLPDPDRRWDTQDAAPITDIAEVGTVKVGCPFAPRCPAVMDICRTVTPPLYQVENRVAACHLYIDKPVLPHRDLMKSFAPPTRTPELITAK